MDMFIHVNLFYKFLFLFLFQAKYSEDEPSLASSWKGDKSAESLLNDPEELQKVVLSERSKNLKLKGLH